MTSLSVSLIPSLCLCLCLSLSCRDENGHYLKNGVEGALDCVEAALNLTRDLGVTLTLLSLSHSLRYGA
jgi:hypothetical protein